MALAGGRCLSGLKPAALALAAGAVDVLLPDLRVCGGLSAGRRLADMAWTHGTAISFAGAFAPLAQLASAHLAAATLHAGPVEVEGLPTPLTELLEPPLLFDNGFLLVPDGPGLGHRVREEFVGRYQGEFDAP
jgi:L-alanine-DL-glutamate epimerase-like enolase superfamily enzyme